MLLFWFVVVVFGLCYRLAIFASVGSRHEWQPIPSDENESGASSNSPRHGIFSLPKTLFKRFVVVPATFGYRCSQPLGWCTIPPRIQSLTIFAFVALNTVLCCINYRAFTGNIYWPAYSTQMWRYISDRTGVISLANFPLIWLFGTRNNVLMWVTGWGFGAYNNFHRWVARVATVQAVVHSIGYTEMIWESESSPNPTTISDLIKN